MILTLMLYHGGSDLHLNPYIKVELHIVTVGYLRFSTFGDIARELKQHSSFRIFFFIRRFFPPSLFLHILDGKNIGQNCVCKSQVGRSISCAEFVYIQSFVYINKQKNYCHFSEYFYLCYLCKNFLKALYSSLQQVLLFTSHLLQPSFTFRGIL